MTNEGVIRCQESSVFNLCGFKDYAIEKRDQDLFYLHGLDLSMNHGCPVATNAVLWRRSVGAFFMSNFDKAGKDWPILKIKSPCQPALINRELHVLRYISDHT